MERLNHTVTRFSSLRAKSPLSCSPPDRKVLLRILQRAAPCLMTHIEGLTNAPTHQSRTTLPGTRSVERSSSYLQGKLPEQLQQSRSSQEE